MEADARGGLTFVEIPAHGVGNHALQLGERVALRLRAHQRLAVAAAQARARWVAAAVALTEKPEAPAPQDVAQLTTLRSAYEELTEAYEAMRRMVERGYLPYRAKP